MRPEAMNERAGPTRHSHRPTVGGALVARLSGAREAIARCGSGGVPRFHKPLRAPGCGISEGEVFTRLPPTNECREFPIPPPSYQSVVRPRYAGKLDAARARVVTADMRARIASLVLVLLLSGQGDATLVLPRRATFGCALAAAASLRPPCVDAAEPIPAVQCDDACMAERVARKAELLRKQDRKGKADTKILFGADYQAGKREAATDKSKLPVVGDFLLPTDVGGLNLQSAGGGAERSKL